MELDYRAIGIRIRRLRKTLGFTQQTLAELSNQEPSNISHIERGATKLSLPTLVNIANALSVSVDQLLIESMDWPETIYLRDIESRLRKFPAPLKEVACELLDDFMHLLERSLLREVINSEHHQWPAKRDKHGF